VSGPKKDISIFAQNLKTEHSYLISGPIQISADKSYVVIRFEYSESSIVVELLDDIVKVQGVKGKDIFDVRFDPYEL
jgi:hypothetical protein